LSATSAAGRWVCLDVGETLIDETRVWSLWADELGVPRLTFLAALGAVIERGGEHRDVFPIFGADDWQLRHPSVERAYGGFTADDLYPDARDAMTALHEAGYRLAIVANQPEARAGQLRAIGIEAEVMAMSEGLGVAKPDGAFYRRALELMGSPDPAAVAYVGDRVDNDVLPSAAAGLRAVWLRRGPWGVIQRLPAGVRPALTVDSLGELVERIDEAWGT
jgi:HAD superfamily hydrolase (TIGR01549 family)